ncbi:MAG: NADH-quinone oxidoreductase subunit NuoK [Candidatus Omnitrophica bacterium CG11_big_fil_rev_8_21_14_0_20_45_26]|uniref:NADH-quinone oxidoreductase subunit K n=1 Tax=Candidatus Abzuiibacterium crystallinum TaxID=1974748 RepID=A0A2H0LM63_9BACT|nr:MAG: NADH-quinone oxidoreductase subunit NuoK [Candidatus Omnitrophica bacterium CG11_big_fil_rev_8_21_14_0_20_45_26]PIW63702.1 MAG: NADH-quinone oxidoreductase subunit NuoK [Candidatus Omnitrophica bacterium CG12_big_fil_rev_8_21_14_0_65_45_16]
MTLSLENYLIVSGMLFAIGALGVMTRRNLIMILLSIEIMLNAVNLSFVAFSSYGDNVTGQVSALFVIAIAACEVAIGLAIAVLVFQSQRTISTDAVSRLKG